MSVTSRIRAKSLLLTYPHCAISKEDALAAIWDSAVRFEPQYAVCCEEKHQDGEPHVHCFLLCGMPVNLNKNQMRSFDLVKEVDGIPQQYHCNIKTAKSPKDAIKYVKKDGKYITRGTCPFTECLSRKEKNALLQTKKLNALVEDGEISIFKIPQLFKAKQILENELLENQTRPGTPEIKWFWGETGSGKTREAVRIGEEDFNGDYWLSNADDKWFDGYHGQQCVILDDIRSNTWEFSKLLRLTDQYRFRVAVKGAFIPWRPRCIIITAPGRPEDVYSNHSTGESFDGIDQLIRRIGEIREFLRPADPEEQEAAELAANWP